MTGTLAHHSLHKSSTTAAATAPTRNPNREPGTRNLEPKFEVLTNQPAILAEIWARTARTARAGVAAPIDATPVAPEIDIASVEVSPVVVKWLVDPAPAVGFPLPFIVRIAAAEAARRPE